MIPHRTVTSLIAQAMVGVYLVAKPIPNGNHQILFESYRKHILIAVRLSKQANQDLLLSQSKNLLNPVHRIIYAYGFFRLNPKENGTVFLNAFPISPPSDLDLSELDKAFSTEDEAPKFPGDKFRFSYWRITEALISLAEKGNAKALRLWLSYSNGWGGAEYIEGNLDDLAELFNRAPSAVVQNWDRFRGRASEIYANEEEPKHFRLLRKRYLKYLPVNHPHRKEILALIDRLEADAKQQKECSRQAWEKFIEKANSGVPQSP